MTRPSQKADQRLIEAAQEMLKETSLSQMNIRQVAAKAGVNLGMFHYHFKSKEQFSRAVMQDVYERFFKNFSMKVEEAETSLGKLKQALLAVGLFVRDHRRLMLNMMRDVLDHNEAALSYVKANGQRHGMVLWDLVGKCQKEGYLEKMPRPQALAYLMPSVVGSSLAVGAAESVAKTLFEKGFLKGADLLVLSDKALQKRIEMALRGLGAGEGGKK